MPKLSSTGKPLSPQTYPQDGSRSASIAAPPGSACPAIRLGVGKPRPHSWRSVRIGGSITNPTPPVKEQLRELVLQAIQTLQADATLPADLALPGFVIERARSREHGDFACNVAMLLAKPARAKPRDLAEKLVAANPYAVNWGPDRPGTPRMLGLHPDHPPAKEKKPRANDLDLK